MTEARLAEIRDESERASSRGDVWKLRGMLRELLAAYDPLYRTLQSNARAHRIEQEMDGGESTLDRIARLRDES